VKVAGVGPQLERYRGMVESEGLAEHVTFLGHIPYENVFDTIATADIAYSDDWSINGFPMKLFDYMALGKAIIAEGTEGVKELLINQSNGLLYATDTEMKEQIVSLANDVALRTSLGQTAQKMMDQHTWEKRVEALGAIYHQFLGLMVT
jgi:glycosyltransferase involved in cell wall biosynthesis